MYQTAGLPPRERLYSLSGGLPTTTVVYIVSMYFIYSGQINISVSRQGKNMYPSYPNYITSLYKFQDERGHVYTNSKQKT